VQNQGQAEATTGRDVTKYYYFNGQRVAMRGSDDAVTWIHGDHLGSTSLTTNESGVAGARQLYAPFGEVRWASGALGTDFGFTGQWEDVYIGLVHMGARWYNVNVGRWVSADTIVPDPGNPQDFNRYTYSRNNPLKYVDPSGHDCLIIGDDEHCGDDLPGHHFVPTVDTWSWDILSEEEKLLAYEAYLRYTENPDYYRFLYWNDRPALTHLQMWAEYAANDELSDILKLDTVRVAVDRLDTIEQEWMSGDISDAEATELKIPLLFLLFAAEIPDESGGATSGSIPAGSLRFDPDQNALIQLAKEAKRGGGVTLEEALALEEWADEYSVVFRGPEIHPTRRFNIPHIHVGPVDHIPLKR
jgi:RHS repeat-associated protein